MLIRLLSLLALTSPFALADVKFISPAVAATVPTGSLTVTWEESNIAPLISSLAGYTLFLMAGGNNDGISQQVATIAGSLATSKSNTLTFAAATGPEATNAYYLKIVSAPTSGTGQVVNYSQRFTISGMTGAWSTPATEADYKSVTGTAGPATVNTVQSGGDANEPAAGGAAAGPYSVSYQLQTGLTKYAPMQPKPGTSITATATTPMFSPSAYSVATTFLPTPSQVTTFTQPVTYSASSMENTAAAAPAPSDNMQKFLARWVD